jgi:hypothetical protein
MAPNGKEMLKEPITIGHITGESARIALNRKASAGEHHRDHGTPADGRTRLFCFQHGICFQ